MNQELLTLLLYKFLNWHPARITTFAALIFAVIKAKTVRIKELAMHIESKGDLNAKIVKLERLFLQQKMNFVDIGKIIIKLMALTNKCKIAIDRTNWQFGKSNLNFFVASVVYGNISLPIACLMLDKKGNSSTAERQKLIEQIVQIIPKSMIELILADREFIGAEWFRYLKACEIPFAIRIKKCERIELAKHSLIKLGKYFVGMKEGESKFIDTKLYGSIDIKITCLQLAKEQLLIASNVLIGHCALLAYKQRWSIERTFKALKSSGFNIEDTHITNLQKLEKLFAIVSLSLAICVIAGDIKHEIKPIVIKNHGRNLYSLFTYGFDWLKDYFVNTQHQFLTALAELLGKKIINAF